MIRLGWVDMGSSFATPALSRTLKSGAESAMFANLMSFQPPCPIVIRMLDIASIYTNEIKDTLAIMARSQVFSALRQESHTHMDIREARLIP